MGENLCSHQESSKIEGWKEMLPTLAFDVGEQQKAVGYREFMGGRQGVVGMDEVYRKLQQQREVINSDIKKMLNKMGCTIEKFRAVEEFKDKINRIQRELLTDFHLLINHTESLVQKRMQAKKNIEALKNKLHTLSTNQQIASFQQHQSHLLEPIKFHLTNSQLTIIHGTQDLQTAHQQELNRITQKFLTLKDYSIKIIEVVMNYNEIDEDEQDCPLPIITKYYQRQRDFILKQTKKNTSQSNSQNDLHTIRRENMRSKHHRTNDRQMEIKLRRMEDRFMTEIEQLSLQNKHLKQQISHLDLKKPEQSQNSTLHSEKQVINLYESKGFHTRKNNR